MIIAGLLKVTDYAVESTIKLFSKSTIETPCSKQGRSAKVIAIEINDLVE